MSDTAKGRAVTTPSSDKAPIGKVLVKDRLSFEAERVYRKGFDRLAHREPRRIRRAEGGVCVFGPAVPGQGHG